MVKFFNPYLKISQEVKKQGNLRKLSSLINKYSGIFMIMQVNIKNNPISGFLYLDIKNTLLDLILHSLH